MLVGLKPGGQVLVISMTMVTLRKNQSFTAKKNNDQIKNKVFGENPGYVCSHLQAVAFAEAQFCVRLRLECIEGNLHKVSS